MCSFRHDAKRPGFTLVELLVVMLIIGMLVGLLLPAVNSVREVARRGGCSSNMRSLANAVLQYEFSRRRLPAATDRNPGASITGNSANSNTRTGYSWLFHVLPYMEENALYDTVSANTAKFEAGPFNSGTSATDLGAWSGQNWTRPHAAAYVVSSAICPTFAGGRTVNVAAHTAANFSTAVGSQLATFAPGGTSTLPAITNYKAMAAAVMDTVNNRPSIHYLAAGAIQFDPDGITNQTTSLPGVEARAVSDGLSKTVLIAETREQGFASWIDGTTCWVVAYSPALTPLRAFLNAGSWRETDSPTGVIITQTSLSLRPSNTVKYLPATRFRSTFDRVPTNGIAWGPSSQHPGGVTLHAYGDGRVCPIQPEINANVYLAICSREGFEGVSPPE